MTYLGLRPGEKLYEELLVKTEELDKTPNSMIFIERDTPLCEHDINARVYLPSLKKMDYDRNKITNVKIRDKNGKEVFYPIKKAMFITASSRQVQLLQW